jgi:DHA2 family multidrug resistance protein
MIEYIEPGQPVPTEIAWRTMAVSGAAAVLGGLSLQAHVLSGNDLGGALGVSADDASWVIAAGVVAEGFAVLVASILVSAFGVRLVIFTGAVTTGLLAAAWLAAGPIGMAARVPLRFAEGFACGLLPVVMMVWSMRGFPPERRVLPLVLFAFASSFPSAFAASATGFATLHWGGCGIFVADLFWPWPLALAAFWFCPREPMQFSRLRDADWVGYAILSTGVGLLLLFLNQGERRFWLETAWMAPLVTAAIVLLALAVAYLLVAKKPLLDLSLLLRSTFAIAMVEALSLRFGLLMASFAVPQALARLAGFRLEQSGEAVLWLAVGQLVGFPLAWAWLTCHDSRWTLGAALGVFSGCRSEGGGNRLVA